MKQTIIVLGAVVIVTGLAACTTPRSPSELSQTTVDYQCGPGGQDPLTVQYTFQGHEALSARIIYQNQVVLLSRSTAGNVDMVGNTFRSDNYTWVTQKFDYDTVGSARGDMLTREIIQPATSVAPAPGVTPSGSTVTPASGTTPMHTNRPVDEVSNIIVRDCVPVAASTSQAG